MLFVLYRGHSALLEICLFDHQPHPQAPKNPCVDILCSVAPAGPIRQHLSTLCPVIQNLDSKVQKRDNAGQRGAASWAISLLKDDIRLADLNYIATSLCSQCPL